MKKYIKPMMKVSNFLTDEILADRVYNILSPTSKGMKPGYTDPLAGNAISFETGSSNVLESIDYTQFFH